MGICGNHLICMWEEYAVQLPNSYLVVGTRYPTFIYTGFSTADR
jgi:hypothetical protein